MGVRDASETISTTKRIKDNEELSIDELKKNCASLIVKHLHSINSLCTDDYRELFDILQRCFEQPVMFDAVPSSTESTKLQSVSELKNYLVVVLYIISKGISSIDQNPTVTVDDVTECIKNNMDIIVKAFINESNILNFINTDYINDLSYISDHYLITIILQYLSICCKYTNLAAYDQHLLNAIFTFLTNLLIKCDINIICSSADILQLIENEDFNIILSEYYKISTNANLLDKQIITDINDIRECFLNLAKVDQKNKLLIVYNIYNIELTVTAILYDNIAYRIANENYSIYLVTDLTIYQKFSNIINSLSAAKHTLNAQLSYLTSSIDLLLYNIINLYCLLDYSDDNETSKKKARVTEFNVYGMIMASYKFLFSNYNAQLCQTKQYTYDEQYSSVNGSTKTASGLYLANYYNIFITALFYAAIRKESYFVTLELFNKLIKEQNERQHPKIDRYLLNNIYFGKNNIELNNTHIIISTLCLCKLNISSTIIYGYGPDIQYICELYCQMTKINQGKLVNSEKIILLTVVFVVFGFFLNSLCNLNLNKSSNKLASNTYDHFLLYNDFINSILNLIIDTYIVIPEQIYYKIFLQSYNCFLDSIFNYVAINTEIKYVSVTAKLISVIELISFKYPQLYYYNKEKIQNQAFEKFYMLKYPVLHLINAKMLYHFQCYKYNVREGTEIIDVRIIPDASILDLYYQYCYGLSINYLKNIYGGNNFTNLLHFMLPTTMLELIVNSVLSLIKTLEMNSNIIIKKQGYNKLLHYINEIIEPIKFLYVLDQHKLYTILICNYANSIIDNFLFYFLIIIQLIQNSELIALKFVLLRFLNDFADINTISSEDKYDKTDCEFKISCFWNSYTNMVYKIKNTHNTIALNEKLLQFIQQLQLIDGMVIVQLYELILCIFPNLDTKMLIKYNLIDVRCLIILIIFKLKSGQEPISDSYNVGGTQVTGNINSQYFDTRFSWLTTASYDYEKYENSNDIPYLLHHDTHLDDKKFHVAYLSAILVAFTYFVFKFNRTSVTNTLSKVLSMVYYPTPIEGKEQGKQQNTYSMSNNVTSSSNQFIMQQFNHTINENRNYANILNEYTDSSTRTILSNNNNSSKQIYNMQLPIDRMCIFICKNYIFKHTSNPDFLKIFSEVEAIDFRCLSSTYIIDFVILLLSNGFTDEDCNKILCRISFEHMVNSLNSILYLLLISQSKNYYFVMQSCLCFLYRLFHSSPIDTRHFIIEMHHQDSWILLSWICSIESNTINDIVKMYALHKVLNQSLSLQLLLENITTSIIALDNMDHIDDYSLAYDIFLIRNIRKLCAYLLSTDLLSINMASDIQFFVQPKSQLLNREEKSDINDVKTPTCSSYIYFKNCNFLGECHCYINIETMVNQLNTNSNAKIAEVFSELILHIKIPTIQNIEKYNHHITQSILKHFYDDSYINLCNSSDYKPAYMIENSWAYEYFENTLNNNFNLPLNLNISLVIVYNIAKMYKTNSNIVVLKIKSTSNSIYSYSLISKSLCNISKIPQIFSKLADCKDIDFTNFFNYLLKLALIQHDMWIIDLLIDQKYLQNYIIYDYNANEKSSKVNYAPFKYLIDYLENKFTIAENNNTSSLSNKLINNLIWPILITYFFLCDYLSINPTYHYLTVTDYTFKQTNLSLSQDSNFATFIELLMSKVYNLINQDSKFSCDVILPFISIIFTRSTKNTEVLMLNHISTRAIGFDYVGQALTDEDIIIIRLLAVFKISYEVLFKYNINELMTIDSPTDELLSNNYFWYYCQSLNQLFYNKWFQSLFSKWIYITFYSDKEVLNYVSFIEEVIEIINIEENHNSNYKECEEPLINYQQKTYQALCGCYQPYQDICRNMLGAFLKHTQNKLYNFRIFKALIRAISLAPFWLKTDSLYTSIQAVINNFTKLYIDEIKLSILTKIEIRKLHKDQSNNTNIQSAQKILEFLHFIKYLIVCLVYNTVCSTTRPACAIFIDALSTFNTLLSTLSGYSLDFTDIQQWLCTHVFNALNIAIPNYSHNLSHAVRLDRKLLLNTIRDLFYLVYQQTHLTLDYEIQFQYSQLLNTTPLTMINQGNGTADVNYANFGIRNIIYNNKSDDVQDISVHSIKNLETSYNNKLDPIVASYLTNIEKLNEPSNASYLLLHNSLYLSCIVSLFLNQYSNDIIELKEIYILICLSYKLSTFYSLNLDSSNDAFRVIIFVYNACKLTLHSANQLFFNERLYYLNLYYENIDYQQLTYISNLIKFKLNTINDHLEPNVLIEWLNMITPSMLLDINISALSALPYNINTFLEMKKLIRNNYLWCIPQKNSIYDYKKVCETLFEYYIIYTLPLELKFNEQEKTLFENWVIGTLYSDVDIKSCNVAEKIDQFFNSTNAYEYNINSDYLISPNDYYIILCKLRYYGEITKSDIEILFNYNNSFLFNSITEKCFVASHDICKSVLNQIRDDYKLRKYYNWNEIMLIEFLYVITEKNNNNNENKTNLAAEDTNIFSLLLYVVKTLTLDNNLVNILLSFINDNINIFFQYKRIDVILSIISYIISNLDIKDIITHKLYDNALFVLLILCNIDSLLLFASRSEINNLVQLSEKIHAVLPFTNNDIVSTTAFWVILYELINDIINFIFRGNNSINNPIIKLTSMLKPFLSTTTYNYFYEYQPWLCTINITDNLQICNLLECFTTFLITLINTESKDEKYNMYKHKISMNLISSFRDFNYNTYYRNELTKHIAKKKQLDYLLKEGIYIGTEIYNTPQFNYYLTDKEFVQACIKSIMPQYKNIYQNKMSCSEYKRLLVSITKLYLSLFNLNLFVGDSKDIIIIYRYICSLSYCHPDCMYNVLIMIKHYLQVVENNIYNNFSNICASFVIFCEITKLTLIIGSNLTKTQQIILTVSKLYFNISRNLKLDAVVSSRQYQLKTSTTLNKHSDAAHNYNTIFDIQNYFTSESINAVDKNTKITIYSGLIVLYYSFIDNNLDCIMLICDQLHNTNIDTDMFLECFFQTNELFLSKLNTKFILLILILCLNQFNTEIELKIKTHEVNRLSSKHITLSNLIDNIYILQNKQIQDSIISLLTYNTLQILNVNRLLNSSMFNNPYNDYIFNHIVGTMIPLTIPNNLELFANKYAAKVTTTNMQIDKRISQLQNDSSILFDYIKLLYSFDYYASDQHDINNNIIQLLLRIKIITLEYEEFNVIVSPILLYNIGNHYGFNMYLMQLFEKSILGYISEIHCEITNEIENKLIEFYCILEKLSNENYILTPLIYFITALLNNSYVLSSFSQDEIKMLEYMKKSNFYDCAILTQTIMKNYTIDKPIHSTNSTNTNHDISSVPEKSQLEPGFILKLTIVQSLYLLTNIIIGNKVVINSSSISSNFFFIGACLSFDIDKLAQMFQNNSLCTIMETDNLLEDMKGIFLLFEYQQHSDNFSTKHKTDAMLHKKLFMCSTLKSSSFIANIGALEQLAMLNQNCMQYILYIIKNMFMLLDYKAQNVYMHKKTSSKNEFFYQRSLFSFQISYLLYQSFFNFLQLLLQLNHKIATNADNVSQTSILISSLGTDIINAIDIWRKKLRIAFPPNALYRQHKKNIFPLLTLYARRITYFKLLENINFKNYIYNNFNTYNYDVQKYIISCLQDKLWTTTFYSEKLRNVIDNPLQSIQLLNYNNAQSIIIDDVILLTIQKINYLIKYQNKSVNIWIACYNMLNAINIEHKHIVSHVLADDITTQKIQILKKIFTNYINSNNTIISELFNAITLKNSQPIRAKILLKKLKILASLPNFLSLPLCNIILNNNELALNKVMITFGNSTYELPEFILYNKNLVIEYNCTNLIIDNSSNKIFMLVAQQLTLKALYLNPTNPSLWIILSKTILDSMQPFLLLTAALLDPQKNTLYVICQIIQNQFNNSTIIALLELDIIEVNLVLAYLLICKKLQLNAEFLETYELISSKNQYSNLISPGSMATVYEKDSINILGDMLMHILKLNLDSTKYSYLFYFSVQIKFKLKLNNLWTELTFEKINFDNTGFKLISIDNIELKVDLLENVSNATVIENNMYASILSTYLLYLHQSLAEYTFYKYNNDKCIRFIYNVSEVHASCNILSKYIMNSSEKVGYYTLKVTTKGYNINSSLILKLYGMKSRKLKVIYDVLKLKNQSVS